MVDEAVPQRTSVLPPEGSEVLLDQMFRLWIEPAIAERGLSLTRADVTTAVVVMPPSEPPRVLINEEAQVIAQLQVTRSVEAGEAVTLDDIAGVADLAPADLDPNAGWVALAKIGNEIVTAFDFRRNRQTAKQLVERANEFVDTALESLGRGHLGPAIENGFAAMELAVKAEMYLMYDTPTTVHSKRVTWWSEWVKLGNAPPETDAILGALYRERGASRYGDRPIEMSEADVRLALEHVQTVIQHARQGCSDHRSPPL